ncbi:7-carboxy-7-deazaguanine synthase QueE [Synechococcus sp. MVIR-18-1]|uniref:7-carboxy-7-deazaguanine synthase QueE n=1 Tax=Synechococcus sp. MVIR-18-1 TaxID=1386941 RepID=UPI001645E412|nr:7-carboxy-7-deazaguanine synthase QueE [Synechococcus sp. MVIR-18-1]QNI77944.1 7-carboxy-7-deazaguanine synthase [Synechococcus sp. MVIR-18-1]
MSESLPVVETFHSLQGEGIHAGRSAFFIRLAGCTVGCTWCDTKHSWPADSHPKRLVMDLATEATAAAKTGAAFVVITGGEPLHHNLAALTAAIRANCDQPVHLETSGVDQLSGAPDWITLSPKRHKPPRAEVVQACHELKVVVHEPADLLFAEVVAAQAPQAHWLLQPGWESETGQQLAIEFAKTNTNWRLSLQSHKWLKVR